MKDLQDRSAYWQKRAEQMEQETKEAKNEFAKKDSSLQEAMAELAALKKGPRRQESVVATSPVQRRTSPIRLSSAAVDMIPHRIVLSPPQPIVPPSSMMNVRQSIGSPSHAQHRQ